MERRFRFSGFGGTVQAIALGAVCFSTLCLLAGSLDAAPARKIYYSSGGIMEADPDGTNPRAIVSGVTARYIVTNSAAGHLYWVQSGLPSAIRRVNLDGTGIVTVGDIPSNFLQSVFC